MNTQTNSPAVSPQTSARPLAVRSYEIDASHSSATFKIRHMMVANVRGELGQIKGRVVLDEADITRSTVEATIEVSTINTRDAKRDEHLRSGDFLDVANHPQITFKSKRVQYAKGDGLLVTGDLTIRGITREVTLEAEAPSSEVKDPWGNTKRGITAKTRINRKDFNVVWNAALDGGGLLVGDEIAVELDIELGRQVASEA
jgi:polyisoprenoid-binding protein YceI